MSKTLKDLSNDVYSMLLTEEEDKKKLYLILEVDEDGTPYIHYSVEKYAPPHNPTIQHLTLGAACRSYDAI